MRFCGVKLTHDGAIAVVEDQRLLFCWEMEKFANRERYAKITDLAIIEDVLRINGLGGVQDIDLMVFDGWHRTQRSHLWHGQEIGVTLAPYRRGIISNAPLQEYSARAFDMAYVSYAHYTTHLAASYCTSPFAARQQDALCMVWDAHMFPYLYLFRYADASITPIGPACFLIATAYFELANRYSPFNYPIEYPTVLNVSGKIMAYVATGQVRGAALDAFKHAYTGACAAVLGPARPVPDTMIQMDVGQRIVARMTASMPVLGYSDADMLASLHDFMSGLLLEGLAQSLQQQPGLPRRLCLSGGATLNIKWNSVIQASQLFDEVWVPPFPTDSGSALGAACCAMLTHSAHRALDWNVYQGPPLNAPICLRGWRQERCTPAQLGVILARDGQPVIFLNGNAELGPRALGHRSILAPAVDRDMTVHLNLIKEREWYRPVAPICLEHRAEAVFTPGLPSPYMLFDQQVRSSWSERIPAVTHLDGTARLQTVNSQQSAEMFELLSAYEAQTGIPVLCNTSANLKGCGFFPDVQSAMAWGRVPRIWSEGWLYSREAASSNECDGQS
jgi:carbamoyltransferase